MTGQDQIHTLPLETVPIKTRALRAARLVKNSRLEGTVELYAENGRGSAQILPAELPHFFEFNAERRADQEMIGALGMLPSYDVYSLRLELRSLGIKVEDQKSLCLSPQKSAELMSYMRVFTRPLITRIYGGQSAEGRDLKDLVALFLDPNMAAAKRNLRDLSRVLGIGIEAIPLFLERYADTYLSLANYSAILSEISQPLADFAVTLQQVHDDRQYANSPGVRKACRSVEERVLKAEQTTGQVLELFRSHTQDMWQNISAERYRCMERLIRDYQRAIAGNLCALVVKMDAWQRLSGKGSLTTCTHFIMSEMSVGIDSVPELDALALEDPWSHADDAETDSIDVLSVA